MGRSLTVLWVCLLVVVAGAAEAQQMDEFIRAKSYCIMDADTGNVLSSLNPQMMLPPASTLKVGTALIAINNLRLTDRVPVSYHAAAAPPSKINIKPGETYSVHDLLYAVLLASANDAARALAERVSGSEARFAAVMTSQLRQLGAFRTNFETASGLPEPGQFSTAYDLALIFRKAMENPTLARIMTTRHYMLDDGKIVRNHNRFLFSTHYAVGGKTGWTRASMHTYVGMFRNGDKRIIISLLGSPNKWPDLRVLIAKGFSEAGSPIAALPPVEERLRKTNDGYSLAGSANSGRSTRARYQTGVVKASIAGGGGRTSRATKTAASGQKKKPVIKTKPRTNAAKGVNPRS